MSVTYLKVKIKSLAEEAKIIRKEENKAQRNYNWLKKRSTRTDEYSNQEVIKVFRLCYELYHHRKSPVGTEARYALIAYGYLRGRKYSQIEQPKKKISVNKYTDPKVGKVYLDDAAARSFKLINKYGPKKITFEEFEAWLAE